ncbi:DUF1737 domain-containing protein [Anatilimnocola sp. NA78]|uniref:DUF1737 domain-containing protein n=1 Tax=Anatilimnocola sp. NA78 TaxID=3415683 RepID=UPI003CE48347
MKLSYGHSVRMRAFMQYTILVASSPEQLAEQVNQRIAEGWMPSGGVSVAVYVGSVTFCQAMMQGQGK